MRLVSRRKFLFGLATLPLVGAWAQQKAEAIVPFQPFSFAYLTDAHLVNGVPDSTYKLTQESQLFLQDIVKQLNASKVDFVVFGGDQVEGVGKDQVNWQLFLDVVQGLNPPWSFVLGESDLKGEPLDKMRTFGPDWKGRGIDTQNSYWSLNPVPGVHIVGLDTSVANGTAGEVSEKQLAWLKDDLTTNKKYFTILFCHHPILPPPPYDGGPPWDQYVIPDGAEVREVIGPFPQVRLVVSGHIHINNVQKEGDIWHVSSGSLDVFPCQYKIFKVDANAITMETWQVPFPALIKKGRKMLEQSNLAFKYNSQQPVQFAILAEGSREDRDAILPLAPGKPLQPLKKKGPPPGGEENKDKGKDKGKEAKEAPADKDKGDDKKDKNDKKAEKEKQKADKKAAKEAEKEAKKSKDSKDSKDSRDSKETKDKKVPEKTKEPATTAPAEDNTEVETAPAPAPDMSEQPDKTE